MLTFIAMLLGFAGGVTTLVVVDSMIAKRDIKLAVAEARAAGYDHGYANGAEDGYSEGVAVGKLECSVTHDHIRNRAAAEAAAENERKWEVDLLPGMLAFERASIRANLLQEQQEAKAKLVSEVEDTYW